MTKPRCRRGTGPSPRFLPIFAHALALAVAPVTGGCGEELGAGSAALEAGSGLAGEVRSLAAAHDVTPIPPAPPVSDSIFTLGQALAFDKVLSGNENISCMTCHHPTLDSDDNRSLSLGEGGLGLGDERVGGAVIPRNAPPLFNLHALDTMFWDMRVEHLGDNYFETPANEELTPEMAAVFEFGVVSAQAMFPVTSREEMRGQRFTNGPNPNELAGDLEEGEIWAGLMARLGAIPEYVQLFEAAYPGTPFADMTFAHAANAIAGFEIRAFESRGSRWQQFLEGDDTALNETELRGAQAFFQDGCGTCHSGPMLTDNLAHNTALAQFGPGKGHSDLHNEDRGREGATQSPYDRYEFRTPPLNNVTLTGPWGHAGQFTDLRRFVEHYQDPAASLQNYDPSAELHPSEFFLADMRAGNDGEILKRMEPDTQVNISDIEAMMAFMETLTDEGSRDLSWTVPARVPSGLPVEDAPAPYVGGEATGTVQFTDIAADPANGLSGYGRVPSARNSIADYWKQRSESDPMVFFDVFETPLRYRGMPGVAVFDYDNDGDEDLFVTNGPGAPNSLFVNQLSQTGRVEFIDRAAVAGVAEVGTDNSGACYGDIDNDGDHDLFVVADHGQSHLYQNNGDGTFADISAGSGAAIEGVGGTSCSFGDIDGDGKLDLFVARAWPQENLHACFTDPFGAGIQHNELFLNAGGGTFTDVSNTSGIRNLGGLPPFAAGAPTITWSVAMVDYDLDGDVDILTADDQCGMPNAKLGGISRGFLQVFDNDGTGVFTNRTVEAGTNEPSAWMGLSFGDFNSDGYLDFFSPSFGDWGKLIAGAPVILGDETSRWFLGAPGKTFVNPGVGELQRMPFGWGTSARDFDNDGDTDITFHGGMDLWFMVDSSNPGSMLLNDGDANFGLDRGAFVQNHTRSNDSGVASADLNHDGFPDMVTVSNFDIPEPFPMHRYGDADRDIYFFSTYDPTAFFTPTFDMVEREYQDYQSKIEREFSWNEDMVFPNGRVRVEMNDGGNANGWVALRLVGAVGTTPGGRVNRDGIGAMITFTPEGGRPVMAPVLGGASHLSQDSLIQGFGLGSAASGTVEILWPGGVRNRLYGVTDGEQLAIPELACSYTTSDDLATYTACVDSELAALEAAGVISNDLRGRMRDSALLAYGQTH